MRYYTILSIQYYTILYYTVLYQTILYYTILSYILGKRGGLPETTGKRSASCVLTCPYHRLGFCEIQDDEMMANALIAHSLLTAHSRHCSWLIPARLPIWHVGHLGI